MEGMMIKRMAAIVFIYLCIAAAWVVLGTTVAERTNTQDERLRSAVGQLWGTPQRQQAPKVYYQTVKQTKVETTRGAETTSEIKTETINHFLLVDASNIDVNLKLEHRQKGLLWYSTYRVKFSGAYRVVNYSEEPRQIFFDFAFPSKDGIYDNFHFLIGGKEPPNLQVNSGKLSGTMKLKPGEVERDEVAYEPPGLDEWWY